MLAAVMPDGGTGEATGPTAALPDPSPPVTANTMATITATASTAGATTVRSTWLLSWRSVWRRRALRQLSSSRVRCGIAVARLDQQPTGTGCAGAGR
ncbi:MAG: hypothetical protein EBU23_18030 [Mycobacteriaceae bacterium]|nr:hypothetical protein [Mycobacteriaceae bacterium]